MCGGCSKPSGLSIMAWTTNSITFCGGRNSFVPITWNMCVNLWSNAHTRYTKFLQSFKDWSTFFQFHWEIKYHRSHVTLLKHFALLKDLQVAHGILFSNENKNIVAAFGGMHVPPAKHSYAWLPRKRDYRTDARTDRQTPEWSLWAAMLRRRHKNCTSILIFIFGNKIPHQSVFHCYIYFIKFEASTQDQLPHDPRLFHCIM